MFQNNKLDSRIRFQRQSFKQQLRAARGYKRPGIAQPGQNSWLRQPGFLKFVLTATILVMAWIYFAYWPNFFTVRRIKISGLNQQQTDRLQNLLTQYLAQTKFLPQYNLLLLNSKTLTAYIKTHDDELTSIGPISKNFPQTLTINATPRRVDFLLSAPAGQYTISSDNYVAAAPPNNPTASSTLPRISLLDGELNDNSLFDDPEQLAAIRFLEEKLPPLTVQPIDYYQISNLSDSDITVYLKNGSKYLFDYKNGLSSSLNELRLLLGNLSPFDQKNLFYVDLRIDKRGYTCLKNKPCASPQPTILDTPTSTTSSTLPQLP